MHFSRFTSIFTAKVHFYELSCHRWSISGARVIDLGGCPASLINFPLLPSILLSRHDLVLVQKKDINTVYTILVKNRKIVQEIWSQLDTSLIWTEHMLRICKFKKRKINLYFLPHKDREIIIKPVIDKQINDVLRCILNICWDLLFETKKNEDSKIQSTNSIQGVNTFLQHY